MTLFVWVARVDLDLKQAKSGELGFFLIFRLCRLLPILKRRKGQDRAGGELGQLVSAAC